MSRFVQHLAWLSVVLVVAGCGSSTGSNDASNSSMDDMARMLDQPKAAAEAKPAPKPEPPPEAVAAEPEKHNVEHVDTSNRSSSYLGAIGGAYRYSRTRIGNLSWITSVKLYRATNGYLPRNTEEFMKCVQADGTPLPEIEQGHHYEYDPSEGQFGTLYDITPSQNPAPAAGDSPDQGAAAPAQ